MNQVTKWTSYLFSLKLKKRTNKNQHSQEKLERYGEHSPILSCDDMEMTFTFAKSIDALQVLFSIGDIPIDDQILSDWQNLDKYLDVPILFQISNNKTWQDKGIFFGYSNYKVINNLNYIMPIGRLHMVTWRL